MSILSQIISPLTHPVIDYIDVMHRAGAAILPYYGTDVETTTKDDGSPVTKADLASNNVILEALSHLDPKIPIISEENSFEENQQLVTEDAFWLVDPLDGTREFLKHTDEFTVCATLVIKGRAVFTLIYVPATTMTYVGGKNYGSYRILQNGSIEELRASVTVTNVVLASRSHREAKTDAYIKEHFSKAKVVSAGSQLKAIALAEGNADIIPRFSSPLHLWDLAPQQALIEGAGGTVTRPDGSPIEYRSSTLLAGDFIAKSPAI